MDRYILNHDDVDFIVNWLSKHKYAQIDFIPCRKMLNKFEMNLDLGHDCGIRCRFKPEDDDNMTWRAGAKLFQTDTGKVVATPVIHWTYKKIDSIYEDPDNEEIVRMGKAMDAIQDLTSPDGVTMKSVLEKMNREQYPLLRITDIKISGLPEERLSIAKFIIGIHNALFIFLANFKAEVRSHSTVRSESTESRTSARSSKKKKKKAQTVTIIPLEKCISDIKSGKVKSPRKKCPYAFEVRGHWRTYQSGKRVWIETYTKNTDKHKSKNRIVKLGKHTNHRKENE